MNEYIIPIKYAIIIFPLIAFLFTLPYIIHLYRKYGSISIFRSFIIYSFILYLITIYFLVILPLPKISEVAKYTTPYTQFIPFNFIIDLINNTSFVITDPNTYLKALKEPYLYTIIFNIFITVPLGIYLRYYFKCSFKKTLLLSFLLSLFFELTQLTGLYFIYPRPYRLFDVDDLMINTIGGILGYLITPIFSKILPSRDKIDKASFEKGKHVSYFRRLVAWGIDFIFVIISTVFLQFFINPRITDNLPVSMFLLTFILYFSLLEAITGGKTIGKAIVKIKIVDISFDKAKIYQYFLRYLLLYGVFAFPRIAFQLLSFSRVLGIFIAFSLGLIFIIYYCNLFFGVLLRKKVLLYEKLSKTTHISTVTIKDDKEETKEKIEDNVEE